MKQEEKQTVDNVPYYTLEAIMERFNQINKRLWLSTVLLTGIVIITNFIWIAVITRTI